MANTKSRGVTAPAESPALWREIPWVSFAVRRRWPLAAGTIALALALGAKALWRQVGPQVTDGEQYRLETTDVVITPPPEWIRSDVLGEALRDASLDGRLSLLDDDLCPKLAKAFALHPWVERVERVEKRAGPRVEATLVYRRPVCMVELREGDEHGLYPVDVQGVLLPTGGFTAEIAKTYPRLGGIPDGAWGPVGAPSRDANVVRGAALAAVLADVWQRLELVRIKPAGKTAERSTSETVFVLETRRHDTVVWGAAPGEEIATEPNAAVKLARLEQLLSDPASSEGESPRQFDLRRKAENQAAKASPRE